MVRMLQMFPCCQTGEMTAAHKLLLRSYPDSVIASYLTGKLLVGIFQMRLGLILWVSALGEISLPFFLPILTDVIMVTVSIQL